MDSNEQDFVRRALMMILLPVFLYAKWRRGRKMRWEDGDFFFFSSFQHRRCVWIHVYLKYLYLFCIILHHDWNIQEALANTWWRTVWNIIASIEDPARIDTEIIDVIVIKSFERKFCARIFRNDGNLNEFSFFIQKEYFNIRQSFLGRQIDPSHFGKMGFSIVLSKFE